MEKDMFDEDDTFIEAKDKPARRLVVLFHGFDGPKRMHQVRNMVHEVLPDADVFLPDFGFSLLGTKHPSTVAANIIIQLDERCAKYHYEDILFVSYSTGATIARKVLIGGWGKIEQSLFESEFNPPDNANRQWHKKVSRLVNVAGMTRGWAVSTRQRLKESLFLNFFGFLGHIIPGYQPTLFRLRRGAPFIVNTRLQWLALMKENANNRPNVAIVNLLGIEDNFVGPLEVIDFAGVLAGDTKIFFIQVPCSDHLNIITVSLRPSKVDKRGRLLLVAMVGIVDGMPTPVLSFKNPVHETVTSHSIPLKYLDDNFSFTRNTDTKHLVFVIHGIRDDGYWTKKVAARIKQRGNNTTEIFASNTKSYGYYTAFPFALPWIRRQKVEWFMDEYATAKALHPKAVFSYVGHSNGTYLAAKALEDYQSCVFERIVFAGSVVRKNYDWCSKFISEVPKVGKLLNYVATNDVVVALFPKGLQTLRLFNLGSAGHDGFDQAEKCPNQIKQLKFVKGGHGAGIQESRWDEISEFIIDGTTPNVDALPENDYQNSRSSSVVAIGYMSTAILFFLVFVIIAVGWALFAPLIDHTWSSTSTSISSWFSVVGMENCINVVTTSLDKLWECYNSLEKKVNAAAVTFYGIFIWYILFRF